MQAAVEKDVSLPAGYSVGWSGQFEYIERAAAKLQTVIPLTLAVILILLYLAFRSVAEAMLLMLTVPFALIGGAGSCGSLGTRLMIMDAIREGAVLRVRTQAMTVAVILAGLLPIMYGTGAGSEIMQRIAAPMAGGMITAPLLSLFVIPAAWCLLQERKLRQAVGTQLPRMVA